MSLVVLENASLALGGRTLFDELDLRIGERDRIGLIGPNGAGKTSLLRLLTREQAPDTGRVRRRRGLQVGHLPQDARLEDHGRTLRAFVVDSAPGRAALEQDLERAQAELERIQAQDPGEDGHEAHHETLLEAAGRVADLNERLAAFEAEYSPHQAERILSGLGFEARDADRDVQELSGGWRMRALLASLLFQRPGLLLLDEPTNHLDMPSVAWLSSFLARYNRAFVLISHDRDFLNEQIDRIVSFEPEGVRTYPGDFDRYERQRAEELAVLRARAEKIKRERDRQQQFIDRFRAKAHKATLVQSRIKQLEKMEDVELPPERKAIRFRFPTCERTGREALRGEGLRKAYGSHVVLDGVDVRAERGDRIALIGRNGAGKTTLLRMLAGEIEPDAGNVVYGYRAKVGYYAQHHAEALPPRATVYDAVAECCPDDSRTRVRAMLGALHMHDDDVEKRIDVLSGGERARVALARLLVDPGNVLLMDEPTNHLDLDSSESLAEALATYDGTILFVSHHRRLLRTLATKIWRVEGGGVEPYPGSLDDYLYAVRTRIERTNGQSASERPDPGDGERDEQGRGNGAERGHERRADAKARKRREAAERAERHKRLAPLEARVRELETRIDELEQAQARCAEQIADPDLYEDAERRDAVLAEQHTVSEELEQRTAEWMEAQQELDRLRADLDAG